jgi:glycine/D-amino acid oxidase-like deaminating enzyme
VAARIVNGRRAFLGAGAALLAGACTPCGGSVPPGELILPNHALGHRLRDGGVPAPTETRKKRVVIVGGGIAGLSAAWRLKRAGFDDFEILELEAQPGGNARSGRSEVTAYPWGAHYVSLPTREARACRLLLAELGLLHGDPDAASPKYEERALVHAPQERLYRRGAWEEGLSPTSGIADSELDQWQRFHERMRAYGRERGRDGRRAFAIPLDFSSRDAAYAAFDRVTMDAWLRAEGFTAECIHWLANYACRDDYGCDYRQTSAWAGIHYFASRHEGDRDGEHDAVLTWPEGNGYVVRALMEKYKFAVVPGALVYRLEEGARAVTLHAWMNAAKRSVAIEAEHVVWAAPLPFAARAMQRGALTDALRTFEHAPWVTVNLHLEEPPYEHHGAPLAWDNVIEDSAALGYVVATHQSVRSRPGPTVVTWYLPLSSDAPLAGRKRLLDTPRERWVEAALADLAKPHPEIRKLTRRADVFGNAHAMVRPLPGLIFGAARERVVGHRGRVHFAHADASGISIFEEANDRGVAAAERVMAAMGARFGTFRGRERT